MNWIQEFLNSFYWIINVMGIILIVCPIISAILIKTTKWGQQFWLLSADYFSVKRSIKPLAYFFTVLFFSLVTVRIDILLSEWNKALYNALQHLDAAEFWTQIIVFSVLASVHIANALLIYYVQKAFTIHWRKWANEVGLDKWFSHQAYYKMYYADKRIDNPDQRIQQDISAYVTNSLSLSLGLIKAVTSMVSFTIILWGLSGPMSIGDFTLPHAMVFLVFIYVLVSTAFAFQIGKPLINLNFNNERLNANYRYSLVRIKEYAESIAFFKGEKVEKNQLIAQFNNVIDNVWQIVYRTLKFNGFNLAVTQTSVIFPFLIQATRFFEKQIQLGELMQTAQAFRRVQTSLSFFRNIYDDFAGYRAVLERLSDFYQAADKARYDVDIQQAVGNRVIFEDLTVKTPEGEILVKNFNINLFEGDSLLVQGISGSGKTTLLRAISGLWRHSEGKIFLPIDNVLFIAQKPYLPQGRLIDCLYYPNVVPEEADMGKLTSILRKVRLEHLVEKLEQENNWMSILSLGEQQRVAFARILLHRPTVIFLDESTSALDEYLEEQMYLLLKKELPQSIVISVGHRSTLVCHHKQYLQLYSDGRWALTYS
ncbi:ABC transporter ATP-binding protein/permease [Rodentibacter haemolyticus]|uniref:ABC transporter ATP-binding protein/permease n=1 Tax=Rodentibacter haemolyticus TaxID=2778911 RepID=A0ABX6UZX6_9PAST|nr:ABC transporter ATP-binding protein/permease [Rodentibacter haemolyticus]QPB43004.1 ABC transporter ATP-binding protein/permease [Rodentibacter haemolyticus]